MPTFKLSRFRGLFLCLLVCLPGCSAPQQADGSAAAVCPAGYVRIARGTVIMGSAASEDGRGDDENQHSVTIRRAFCMKATPPPPVCPAGYVAIAPGTFTMGSPNSEEARDDDETQHRVTITRGYCMKATPPPAVCPAGYVGIAPGTFTMGSPNSEDDLDDDETQHSVTITRGYCMKATEVTQGEWQAVMGSNPSDFKSCGANCPVERVSWDDAVGYANALSRREGLPECYNGSTFTGLTCRGYRLPTEAEWEYAARAGTTSGAYGIDPGSAAWLDEGWGGATHPVRQIQPNAWGLYDMLGSVCEWTGDWYDTYPATATDPTGPTTGSTRVFRYGWWYHWDDGNRGAASRYSFSPDGFGPFLGFRLVKTAP